MHQEFREVVEGLVPSFEQLMDKDPIVGGKLQVPPEMRGLKLAGVYLFSEGEDHLYVGRTNNLANRYRNHCSPSARDGVAPFAYRLACETSGRTNVSYVKGHQDTRAAKMADPEFQRHFAEAKDRIRKMEFRYVLVSDPIRQAILEVYCSVALATPHNSFENH